jgi:hypothetical protein
MLFSELKWRTWSSEWHNGKTKFVCSKSADYNRSFKRSIHSWEHQGLLTITPVKSQITYGMAANLAVFTALERGQLSAPRPEKMVRLYFDDQWCSIVIAVDDIIAVNLGAIFIGMSNRYSVASINRQTDLSDEMHLSACQWIIRLSSSGKEVDPFETLPDPPSRRFGCPYFHDSITAESFAAEGVALSLRHSTPGRIGPYMLTGEQLATSLTRNDHCINVPVVGAH